MNDRVTGTERRFPWKKAGLVAGLLGLVVAVRLSGLDQYFTLDNLKTRKDELLLFVDSHYLVSISAYVLLYIVTTALSLPGATVLTLAGGFLFGTLPAVVLVNVGATTGAACAFLLTRYLIGEWLQRRYAQKLTAINDEIARSGPNYLLVLRLVPLFPFFLVNIVAGLTRIRFSTYLWTTALGILPADIVYTFTGTQLGTISRPADIISGRMIMAFAGLALLSAVPIAYRTMRSRWQGRR
jgi:uncharacterized membrane protein YdjX (TVP38/TMEM64 family)